MEKDSSSDNKFFLNFLSVVLSAFLFALAFPNVFIEKGFPFALWVAYIPIFLLINRIKLRFCPLWGLLYGSLSMSLFNYWLVSFDFIAALFCVSLFAVYFAVFFTLLKIAVLLFPKKGWILQCLLWIAFEYLRTFGFLGYSYGITGYSQWTLPYLIKIADITGVWGVSALIIFPGACIAGLISGGSGKTFIACQGNKFLKRGGAEKVNAAQKSENFFKKDGVRPLLPLFIWIIVLIFVILYGFASKIDYSNEKNIKISLIQPNSDPWKSDLNEFRLELENLQRLSDMALSEVPSPDLVVWPETAFVPSFYYHSRYRVDADSYALVKDALDYLGSKKTPFVIGNDEARIGIDGSPLEYNSALLFSENEFKARYYKRKLVPFSEYFPYGEQFPSIYNFLESKVAHFWNEGQNPVVFELNGYKFSTPICFEDTFGGISREFVQDGAELIVNLSNDSWSKSLSCQNQHLGMAVFRAVENRRSVVRSTTSGQTCAIDPNGFIMAEAPPFEERVLSVNVPVLKSLSIYTRAGDVLPLAAVFASLVALIARLFLAIIRRTKAGKKWQTIINHL